MLNLFKIILILVFFALPSYGEEVEWNDKPILCGEDTDIFGLLAGRDERLVFKGIIGSKVRDPDNADGLADNMARLSFAMYVNFSTGTFSILEYHGAPYDVYCIIAAGDNLEIAEWGRDI